MILIRKLHDRTSELSQVHIYEIGKLVTGKYSLLLKDADISPCLYLLGLDIPESCITQQIRAVMKESCRSYDLSIACSGDIHHLGRLGTQQDHKAILGLL